MPKKLISGWSIVGALVTVIILLTFYSVLVRIIFPDYPESSIPTAIMQIVVAETPTKMAQLTDSGVPQPSATLDPMKYGGIGIDKYVQITGTDGDGLRLRSSPGVDSSALFLGLDAEVFRVVEGPADADGMIWWYLVSPTDENRKGWASASYLVLVPSNP